MAGDLVCEVYVFIAFQTVARILAAASRIARGILARGLFLGRVAADCSGPIPALGNCSLHFGDRGSVRSLTQLPNSGIDPLSAAIPARGERGKNKWAGRSSACHDSSDGVVVGQALQFQRAELRLSVKA